MPIFASYLFEVSLCIGIVLLIYVLFLKRTTFFKLNRFYLLGGLVIALILPLISLPQTIAENAAGLPDISLGKIETEYIPFNFSEGDKAAGFDLSLLTTALYVCGVCFFSFRLIRGLVNLFRLERRSTKVRVHGIDVCLQKTASVYSFYKFIFAPANVDKLVLRHERIHVLQMHWIDNLLLELVAIALWFNPFMLLYKREIKAQHEFLADRGALESEEDEREYMLCLIQTTYAHNGLAVASHFGSNTIKNRIIMLTKNKTPLYRTMSYFLIVPAAAFLLLAFQESAVPAMPHTSTAIISSQTVPDGAPIESGKIKSTVGFGERLHPATGKMAKHTGVDLVADEGVEVVATGEGVVVESSFNDLKGNFVVIRHDNQFSTQYFHLLKSSVSKGTTVKKGEVIGLVGSTGVLSTSTHLHYEVLKDGKAVNPVEYLPKGYIE